MLRWILSFFTEPDDPTVCDACGGNCGQCGGSGTRTSYIWSKTKWNKKYQSFGDWIPNSRWRP